jgi:hypothetical protein
MRASRDVDPSELKADPLAFTPAARKPRRRWGLRLAVIFLLLVAASAAGAWYQYGNRLKVMLGLSARSEIPLVKADPGPIKVRPESPGGMEVPDRDKLVYQRIQGEGGEEKVERLLPPPETPLPPPVKPATAEAPAKPAPESAASAAPPPPPPPAELAVRPRPSVPPQVTEPLPKVPTAAQVAKTKPPAPAPIAPPESTKTSPPAAEAKPAASAPPKASPEPAPAAVAVKAPTGDSAPAPTPAPATTKGYLIQLAAVRQPEQARKEWERLQRAYPDLLGDLQLSVIKADLGPQKGIYYRLRAGPLPDEATARKRCAGLSQQKVGCLVVRISE